MCRTSTDIYPPESFTDRARGPPSELQQHASRWLANNIYWIPSDKLHIKSWWHTSGKHPGCLASAPNSGLYAHHFAVGSFLLASPHQRHLCQILYYPTGLRPHPFHESQSFEGRSHFQLCVFLWYALSPRSSSCSL